MQLTSKEINRNNRVSLGVTIFSFMVLLLFLIFKNIMSPNSSLVADNPAGFNIVMGDANPYDSNNGKKTTGLIVGKREDKTGKKEIAVSDDDINAFNNAANELLEAYKTNTAKNSDLSNVSIESNSPGTIEEKNNLKVDNAQIGFDLGKRQLITMPTYANDTNEDGKVIVEIVVNKDGTVIEANPNGRGTTTSSSTLKAKAKQMAIESKFSPAAGIEEQSGSITVNFSFK